PLLDDFGDFAGSAAAGLDITDDRHRDFSIRPHRCGHRQLRVAPYRDLHPIVHADTIIPFEAGEPLSRVISGLRNPGYILTTGHGECRHERTSPAPLFHHDAPREPSCFGTEIRRLPRQVADEAMVPATVT